MTILSRCRCIKSVFYYSFHPFPNKFHLQEMADRTPVTPMRVESSLESQNYDGIVLVSAPNLKITHNVLQEAVCQALSYDPALKTETAVLPLPTIRSKLVYSPTGPIDLDYQDVRVLKNAAEKGIKRALKSGIKKPLLVLEEYPAFEKAELVTLLGALQALYTPIQVREFDNTKTNKVEHLGVITNNVEKTRRLIKIAEVLESGRRVACDIGDADPERMSPPRVEEYVRGVFANSNIKMEVISDINEIRKSYPLFEAVNRAASVVDRHQGRIVFLEYKPADQVTETLYLVGKGVTYDTGGADVKIEGNMRGMSRDKWGAAAAVGFMRTVDLLQPKGLRVVAAVGLVRNSIGSNGYVADEVITARCGKRIRVGNTDAEGRMIMADLLCKLKEDALKAVNPHLYTIATLTGHAWLAVGDGFSIVMDNGPAKKVNHSARLQKASEVIGDPFEVSVVRHEDFNAAKGAGEGDDVLQSTPRPSSKTPRGHQIPAAFLMLASGLDEHGSSSDKPLKYSHLDIVGPACLFPQPATGGPVLALAETYLLKNV